ncbi:ABC transporter substrate-binding protein [Diaphorobacter ruginosibacter]|uniref:ABC transporter substrate-binding protein n=2 Tax=Diaphorobacter ruginosibacter TaxID=1715720 RepID=A0A7G9RVG9_9BURK|nr:ABC transporter substrate-binding protein [Diaphorobacter ruginosibacter]
MPVGLLPLPFLKRHAVALMAVLGLAACSEHSSSTGAPAAPAAPGRSVRAPVTIEVCGHPVTYARVPQRAVTHGINITEMFLALGLQERLVGYGGLRDVKRLPQAMQPLLASVPDLSNQGMNLETLINAQPDFVFSGWAYGFRQGQITPGSLRELGIDSYVLSESCIRQVARERVSLEDTFNDLLNLGRIFDIEERATALVNAQRAELQRITDALGGLKEKPRVFVFDSGTDIPVTTGRYAMPQAMIEAAGGSNIFDDLNSSWMSGNWEDVIARNPDWIVIVDNDRPTPDGKRQFLLGKPELSQVKAIREQNFVLMDFSEATPGPRNVDAVRRLAHALHPQQVTQP